MDSDLELQRSLSEPNGLFIFSPDTPKDPYSNASSAASLIHLPSWFPFPNGKSIRHSLSVDHFDTKRQDLKSMKVLRRSQLSSSLIKSSSSSSSSSSDDNACHQDSNDLQYSRFDDSPSRIESSPSHIYLERMMLTSIPRRKEFSEQFRDLAQLHENSDIPRAKWDDASRLFPKQFGLPPSVAISIWKQVDSDGDMMLTESEYCLAAHLANKYFTTGFSLLASPSHAPPPTQCHRGDTNADASTSPSSSQSSTSRQQHNRQSRQLGRHRGNRRRQPPLNGQDAVYLVNDEDDSHDLLLSPNPRPLDGADVQPTPWSFSSNSRSPSPTYKEHPASLDQVVYEAVDEEFEEEEYLDDDDHKVVSDDEIGVRALLPTSNSSISAIHCRHSHGADVNGKRRIKKSEKVGGIGRSRRKSSSDSSSSSSSPTSSSSSQICNSSEEEEDESFSSSEEGNVSNSEDSSASQSSSHSSSPERVASTRMESVYSTSPSVKVIDPVEVLSKVTHRSIDEILLLSAHRRRRLLVSLVRAAKSTNYMLLRLNNELAGELQELCDQHTNLNAQVRHLSELGP